MISKIRSLFSLLCYLTTFFGVGYAFYLFAVNDFSSVEYAKIYNEGWSMVAASLFLAFVFAVVVDIFLKPLSRKHQ